LELGISLDVGAWNLEFLISRPRNLPRRSLGAGGSAVEMPFLNLYPRDPRFGLEINRSARHSSKRDRQNAARLRVAATKM
jgi:hypothetical protein